MGRSTDLCRILSLSTQIRQHDEVPEEEAPWEGKQPCILLDRMKSKPLEDEDGIEGAWCDTLHSKACDDSSYHEEANRI